MTKSDHEPEALIDLGAATDQTKGGLVKETFDNPQSSRKDQIGMSAD